MVSGLRSAMGGLVMLAGVATAGTNDVSSAVSAVSAVEPSVVTNAPSCTAMRFTKVTFPVRTNALELTYSGFNTTGDWYLLTTDKLQGANTVWRPAANQGYNHSRFGYVKGAFPFEVTTTDAPTIIVEYLGTSEAQFFKVVNSIEELNKVPN